MPDLVRYRQGRTVCHHRTASNHSLDSSKEGLGMNPTQEVWKPVAGYEGYYEVSDHGRLRGVDRTVISLTGPRRVRGRTISQVTRGGGYFTAWLSRGGEQKFLSVHRLVAEAFCERVADGDVVRHLDGDPKNNRAENLAWGTQSENNHDQVRHGTHDRARRTHCRSGHEYTAENTYIDRSNGVISRTCRICQRATVARYKARKLSKLSGADQ